MREKKQTEEQTELFSYNPLVIVWDVLKRWYLIAAVALIAGMAAFVLAETQYVPEYTASATFVVSTRDKTSTVFQNLSAATSLASMSSEILNSSLLREFLLEELELPSFTGRITASAIPETNLLTMQVTDRSPRTAFLAARVIVDEHHRISGRILGDTVLDVLQQPSVPMGPSNPLNARGSMKKAAAAAGLAMCGLLGLASFLRDAVRSKAEAESKLNLRVLCELHHERKHRSFRALLEKQKSSILILNPVTSFSYVEKIRRLRRRVEQLMPGEGGVLLVASALENEGKSTVAANLALSLAQKHKNVLLIEGDLRRPALHKILGLEGDAHGTADVIQGTPLERRVIRSKKLGGLSVLPESRPQRRSVNLAGSGGMADLLRQAREQYAYVVVDTPPMAVGADAECLAAMADASLLVVRQNAASAGVLNRALDVLEGSGAQVLGCVLNDVLTADLLATADSYGYGYGYGHSYGHYGHYGRYGQYGAYGKSKGR